jgi:pimeloyl-ACP methyl ester carboxylesterase
VNDTFFLVRGLSREAGHWGGFLTAFRHAFPDDQVHPLDLPGVGALRHERWPGSVPAAMERLRAQAPAAAGRTFVLGMSLGGMVTLEWAARYPGELAGVIVLGSSGGDLSPPWHRLRPAAWPLLLKVSLSRDVAIRERWLIEHLINRREHWGETHASWTQLARERPIAGREQRGQILAASRWRAPAAIDVPSIFLVGGRDRFVHPACSVALAARYRARLAVEPNAGHDLTSDEPAWVIAQVRRFLATLP